jgi:hypothetical protein
MGFFGEVFNELMDAKKGVGVALVGYGTYLIIRGRFIEGEAAKKIQQGLKLSASLSKVGGTVSYLFSTTSSISEDPAPVYLLAGQVIVNEDVYTLVLAGGGLEQHSTAGLDGEQLGKLRMFLERRSVAITSALQMEVDMPPMWLRDP